MNNIDFRHRLNNHKTEFNPSAWEQMNDMLDSIPANDKKRRKGFWWLFLVSISLITVIGSYFIYLNSIKPKVKPIITTSKVPNNNETITSKNIVVNDSTPKNNTIVKANIDETKEFKTVKTAVSQSNGGSNNKIRRWQGTEGMEYKMKSNNIPSWRGTNAVDNPNKKDLNLTPEIESTYKSENIKYTNTKSINNDEFTDKATIGKNNKEKSIFKQKNNIGLKNSKYITIEKLNTNSEYLKYHKDLKYNGIIMSLPPNYRAKLNKLLFSSKVGYASFNGSPGFHLGAGVTYRVNKLIYLESELGYSYGSRKNITFNGIFHREYQYETNLIAILNLITKKDINIAFEIGAGYTIYRGRRVLRNFIDFRKHSGLNLQGGLSLSYFINAKYGIGFKWGIISYDDGVSYLAFRYMKRF